MNTKQVKATLRPPLANEMDLLCDHLGLCPSSTLKLAIRRLAQSELPQKTTSSDLTKEVA